MTHEGCVFSHSGETFFMAKVPKIQCYTILRMFFFSKNKVIATKKRLLKMTTKMIWNE